METFVLYACTKGMSNLNLLIMKNLEYKIVISAPAKKVWDTMLNLETYQQWVAKSWPNSSYVGKWATGEKIKFIGPHGAGTLAELVEVKPYERVLARHIAVLGEGGVEDRTSEEAKVWVGITEEYRFAENKGKTTVTVLMSTPEEWAKMFDEGWPIALEELKTLAERKLATA
jgi:uncharacterized protein YndB with AHSA1/START domain